MLFSNLLSKTSQVLKSKLKTIYLDYSLTMYKFSVLYCCGLCCTRTRFYAWNFSRTNSNLYGVSGFVVRKFLRLPGVDNVFFPFSFLSPKSSNSISIFYGLTIHSIRLSIYGREPILVHFHFVSVLFYYFLPIHFENSIFIGVAIKWRISHGIVFDY